MLHWAIHQRHAGEFFGQLVRIVGAATKTVFGLVPVGNTGGSSVSPFEPMLLQPEHDSIIARAKKDL